jgi:hypothetical protein
MRQLSPGRYTLEDPHVLSLMNDLQTGQVQDYPALAGPVHREPDHLGALAR